MARTWCAKHYSRWSTHGDPLYERQLPTLEERFWDKVDLSEDCWEWQGSRSRFGYGRFNRDGKVVLAHRLSWEMHRGGIPEGLQVLHECDNPPCVRVDHLFLGTHADNNLDMQSKGRDRQARGERSGMAKLTDGQVADIRRRVASGETQTAVGAAYGIHSAHVSRLVRGLRRASGTLHGTVGLWHAPAPP